MGYCRYDLAFQILLIFILNLEIVGQERFGNMTRVYYKEAVGAFIVFDVTRSATFDAVVKWKQVRESDYHCKRLFFDFCLIIQQDLDSKVQLPNGSPIPCILLANKVKNRPSKYLGYIFIKNGFSSVINKNKVLPLRLIK